MTIGATSQKLFDDFQALGEYIQGKTEGYEMTIEAAGADLYTLNWGSCLVGKIYAYVVNFLYRIWREGLFTCASTQEKLQQVDVIIKCDFDKMMRAYHKWACHLYVDKVESHERVKYLANLPEKARREFFSDIALHYRFTAENVDKDEWQAYGMQLVGLSLIHRVIEATQFSMLGNEADHLRETFTVCQLIPRIFQTVTIVPNTEMTAEAVRVIAQGFDLEQITF